MNNADAKNQIRRAYSTWKTIAQGATYMPITEVVDRTDLTMEQISEAIRDLYRTDASFSAIPNSIQGDLTMDDREYAVRIGMRMVHLIAW